MSKKHTLSEIADLLGAKLQGDRHCVIEKVSSLENAKSGSISLLVKKQYQKFLSTTCASAVVVPEDFKPDREGNFLFMSDPHKGQMMLARLFDQPITQAPGVHPSAVIGDGCQVPQSVSIGPNCVLGDQVTVGENTVIRAGTVIDSNCVIGRDCLLYPNVTLYAGVTIGDRVIIHSGAVVGSDGFGNHNNNGVWEKIPQLGSVRVGNDVEIGANTTIDCGAIDDTIIEDGVKLDNLVMIAHNVRIGAHTAVAGCVGIAGSTKIGKHCMIGGATGIADNLEICDQTMFTGNCFVTRSIDKPGVYSSGLPAQPREKWQRSVVQFRRLNNLAARLKQLERDVHEHSENS